MKKILVLVSALFLVLTLAACGGNTVDDPDPVALTVTLSGLTDKEITAGDAIDLLEGVTAMGSDNVDYSDLINVDSDDCDVTNNTINTANPNTCHITYTVVVGGKIVRDTLVVTINPIEIGPVEGPIVAEWHWDTEADLDGWAKYEAGGGSVATSVEDGAMKLVTTSGGLVYETRLDFMGVPLENGYAYEVSFRAKSDIDGKAMNLQIGQLIAQDPWFVDFKPGQMEYVTLSTEWQTFTYSFMMSINNQNGGPLFEMGNINDADAGINSVGLDAIIWIDDLVIKGGSGEDTIDPTIDGADDVTIFIGDVTSFDPLAGVTATDYPDVDLTDDIILSGDTVDVTTAGVYFLYYVVFDDAFNSERVDRMVTVTEDTEAPVLSGVEDAVFFLGDGNDALTDVMAVDNRDGDVTADIVLSGDVFDAETAGVYVVTYTVEDELGNIATVDRTIELLDVVFINAPGIPSGDFEAGPWVGYVAEWEGTSAKHNVIDGELVFDIANLGNANWHLLLEQGGIQLEVGKTYRLTFDAMSSVARTIQANLAYGGDHNVDVAITDTMTTYTVDYVFDGTEAAEAMVKIMFGKLDETTPISVITFDNIMFEELDATPEVVAGTDQIENGMFDGDYMNTGWSTWSSTGDEDFRVYYAEGWFTYNAANANFWENKLEHLNIPMEAGKVYRLTFDAKGDAARDFQVSFWDGGQGFESGPLQLTTDFTTYTYIFTYTGGPNAALEFQLGQLTENFAGTRFFIDNVLLEVQEGDAVVSDAAWEDFGIAVAETETDVTLTYDGITANWWEKNAQYKNLVFDATRTAVEFTFTGTAGHEYLFKIEGGGNFKELAIVADGNEQTLLINLDEFSAAQRAAFNLFIFFCKTDTASGSAVVAWDYSGEAVMLPVWTGYGTHTAVEGEGDVEVTYSGITANWWEGNTQYSNFAFDGNNDAILFTFTGTAGHDYLFKIEGGGNAKELGITADGNEQTLFIPLDEFTKEQRDAFNLLIFFVQTTDAAGTATVSWEHANLPGWTGYGMTVVEGTGNEMTATYDVTTEWWWDFNAQYQDFDFDGTNEAVEFTFTGTDTHTYLFKVERADGTAVELGITADGTEQTLLIDLSAWSEAERATITKLVFFANLQGQAGSVTVDWDYGVLPV